MVKPAEQTDELNRIDCALLITERGNCPVNLMLNRTHILDCQVIYGKVFSPNVQQQTKEQGRDDSRAAIYHIKNEIQFN